MAVIAPVVATNMPLVTPGYPMVSVAGAGTLGNNGTNVTQAREVPASAPAAALVAAHVQSGHKGDRSL